MTDIPMIPKTKLGRWLHVYRPFMNLVLWMMIVTLNLGFYFWTHNEWNLLLALVYALPSALFFFSALRESRVRKKRLEEISKLLDMRIRTAYQRNGHAQSTGR